MKSIIIFALAMVAIATVAQSLPPNPADPANQKPRKERYKHAAGLVSRDVKDGKCIRFIDMRKNPTDLSSAIAEMPRFFETKVEIVKSELKEDCAMKTAQKAMNDCNVGAVVVIANEGIDYPAIVVCPEDRMGVINADRLMVDLPSENPEEVLRQRFTKEMWRAVAFILGGFESQYPCVMKSAFGVKDLDANPLLMTCPPVSGNVAKNAQKFDFAKVQSVPYFIALRQGWAPAPVNDAQKEEVARFEKMKAAKEAKSKAAKADEKPAEAPAK